VPANSEVWSYDGATWTLITTSPGGPPVNEASHGDIAFDEARGKLVLVCEGPPSSPVPKNVTWEFDSVAATWQQVSEGFGPSHSSSSLAFDPGLGLTIGQYYGLTTAITEARTWTQAGGPWAAAVGISTPARYWPVMAYDALRERTTIYGCCRNLGPGSYTTDTHALGGGQWSMVLPDFHTTQGSAVVPLGMAFDTRRRAMVMVGGSYDDYWLGVPLQTWEYRYLDRVVIDRQPQDQPLGIGQDAAFTVYAAGLGTLTYQWRKGGTPLANGPTSGGSVISGAQSATLTISGLVGSDAGSYSCVVSNPCGAVATNPAMLGSPCYPDCNQSATLTIADFGCFQTRFVAGDPYADCNGVGGLTIADFGCFQTKFVAGCP
jgi:Immunoglobulin I-set domain